MYKLKAAKEVGGYSKYFSYAQDYCLLINLAEKYSITVLDEFLCIYRVMPSSMTQTRCMQRLITQEQIKLLGLAREKLKLSSRSIKLNLLSTAISQIRLGLIDIYDGSIFKGLIHIFRTLWKYSIVLCGNTPVR